MPIHSPSRASTGVSSNAEPNNDAASFDGKHLFASAIFTGRSAGLLLRLRLATRKPSPLQLPLKWR
jgi:hypothetical protein